LQKSHQSRVPEKYVFLNRKQKHYFNKGRLHNFAFRSFCSKLGVFTTDKEKVKDYG